MAIPGSGSTSLLQSLHHHHHQQQQQAQPHQQHLLGGTADTSPLSGLANTGSLPDLTLREHLLPSNPMSVPVPDAENGVSVVRVCVPDLTLREHLLPSNPMSVPVPDAENGVSVACVCLI